MDGPHFSLPSESQDTSWRSWLGTFWRQQRGSLRPEREDNNPWRAKRLLWFLSLSAINAILVLFHHLWQGQLLVALQVVAVLLVFALCWWLIRRPGYTILSSKIYLSAQFVSIVFASLQDGQGYSETLFLLFIVPLGTAYLLGVRETLIASAFCAAAVVLVAASGHYWPLPEIRSDSVLDWTVIRLVGISVVTACAISTAQATRRERLALLSHSQELERAKQAAEAASRTKSTFLANMSHEIRTPLNGVLGMVQDLRDRQLERQDADAVEVIHQSSEHLLQLLNELLDLSHLGVAKPEVSSSDFDLRSSMLEVRALFSSTLSAAGIALKVKGESDKCWVRGDRRRLKQILCSLLGNAIKLSGGSDIEMSLELRPGTRGVNRRFAKFCVRFSAVVGYEDIEALFSPLEDDKGGRSARWGVGLSMSRQLARASGGDVTAEHLSGSDICLGLTLPFEMSSEPKAPVPQRIRGKAARPKGMGQLPNYRVLVVDDNETNRMVMLRSLERWGCQVQEACDGVEAVEFAERERFDLILMDIRMPRMDGLEATTQIRVSRGPNRRTPIVAVTAHTYPEDLDRCTQAGMQGHLGKPFRLDVLHALVQEHAGSESRVRPVSGTYPRHESPVVH